MEVRLDQAIHLGLDYKKTDIGRELKKKVVGENKLKTFNLNFTKKKK